jgi:hypothetical protein
MSDANDDTDEKGSTTQKPVSTVKGKSSFGFLKSDDDKYEARDIRSPITIRLLIEHIDKLEAEVSDLKEYQQKYYDASSDKRVLESQADLTWSSKAISSALLAAGGAGVGASPSFFDQDHHGFIFLAFSFIVAASSFFIKVK